MTIGVGSPQTLWNLNYFNLPGQMIDRFKLGSGEISIAQRERSLKDLRTEQIPLRWVGFVECLGFWEVGIVYRMFGVYRVFIKRVYRVYRVFIGFIGCL